jgi:Zn-dependent M28 family amino/carboxypeptidase
VTIPVHDRDQISEQWICRRGAAAQLERAAIVERTDLRAGARDPDTAALLEQLSLPRFLDYLADITRPATRHSRSAGYTEARETAEGHLQATGFAVTRAPVVVGNGVCHNVIAEMTGTAATRDVVVVTAHLDSINHRDGPAAPAPGADDNASGSAGALELATALATRQWPNDLRVILFGGEEEGLLGSIAYVAALSASERARMRMVLNMDMIGRRNTATVGVLIEGAAVSQHVIESLAAAAATWTDLAVSTSLNPFASDHVPFIDAGVPAVLTIEADDSANDDVHTAGDTADTLDPTLCEQILSMNLAVLSDALHKAA